MNIQVPGFRSIEINLGADGGTASCVTKQDTNLYFVYLTLTRRDDGTLREKVRRAGSVSVALNAHRSAIPTSQETDNEKI